MSRADDTARPPESLAWAIQSLEGFALTLRSMTEEQWSELELDVLYASIAYSAAITRCLRHVADPIWTGKSIEALTARE